MTRLRPVAAALAVLLVALLSGCGLAMPSGVRAAGEVPAEQPRAGAVVVLPPGPAPGASARGIVNGFLAAQTSAQDDFRIARQFLAPGLDWRPTAHSIEVYEVASADFSQPSDDDDTITVVSPRVATVRRDGSYVRAEGELTDAYTVGCSSGRCRIIALPPDYGLRLSQRDLTASYAPQRVMYLAPDTEGAGQGGHLVADLVWLPRDEQDLARHLVEALVLRGPSSALVGSVRTAVPPGTAVLSVRTAADGTVTVDLSRQVQQLDASGRERLSAQLVWTLRALGASFTSLRLRSEGSALRVAGRSTAQAATAWGDYDPERLRAGTDAYYLQDRRVQALQGDVPLSDEVQDGVAVDAAAISPDGRAALLTERAPGRVELRAGGRTGAAGPVQLTGDLSSPSWGSGEQGLWLLRGDQVELVPEQGRPRVVPVEGTDRLGPVRRLQVGRDGVRVAMLVGSEERPRLVVGRVVVRESGLRVVGLREIRPGLSEVADVAWADSTTLVVLSRFPFGRLPAELPVDGSSVTVTSSRKAEGVDLVSLTAAPGQPLVLGATVGTGAAERERVFEDDGQVLRDQGDGRAPFYPG